jgi:hypothetical protein
MSEHPPSYRPVNAMLGAQPKIGPLPANQLFPWMVISLGLWFLASLVSLPTIWTILLVFWGDVTWWLLTGKQPWRFLSKFIGVPNLTRGRVRYQSIYGYMNAQQNATTKVTKTTKRKANVKANSQAKRRQA